MFGIIAKGAFKVMGMLGGANTRRGPHPSIAQMFTTSSPTNMGHVEKTAKLYDALILARDRYDKKLEERTSVLQYIKELDSEKDKLSQEIKDLKRKLNEALSPMDYLCLYLIFDNDTAPDEMIERYFKCSLNEIDKSISQTFVSFKSLAKNEKALKLKEQERRPHIDRLREIEKTLHLYYKDVVTPRSELRKIYCQVNFMELTNRNLPILPVEDYNNPGLESTPDLTSCFASPLRVRTMEISSFLRYCSDHGYVDILRELYSSVDFSSPFETMSKQSSLNNEGAVVKAFGKVVQILLEAMGEKPNANVPRHLTMSRDGVMQTLGAPGLVIFNKEDNDSRTKLIVGEFFSEKITYDDLSASFCDYDCVDDEYPSERHGGCSGVHRLYNYMVLNGLLVGIYSNYRQTFVLIRDCEGNLLITEPVWDEDVSDIANGKVSAMQLVSLAILLAADKSEMDFKDSGCPEFVSCSGGPEVTRERCVLPDLCMRDRDRKESKSKDANSVDATKFDQEVTRADEQIYLPLVLLSGYTELSPGHTGRTIRVDLPLSSGEKVDTVLKILDYHKQHQVVRELQQEAKVYKHLKPLQGKSIPEFVGCGFFACDMVYGLGTKYAGEPLLPEHITDEFVEKAVTALREIHSYGVTHQDVAIRNILYNKETQGPVIIDFGSASFFKCSGEDNAWFMEDFVEHDIHRLRYELETERKKSRKS